MNKRTRLLITGCATALAASATSLRAQYPDDPAVDRARIAQLLARGTTSPDTTRDSGLRLAPWRALVAWNSDLPFSLNDGPLWAGRGLSASITGGVSWSSRSGPVRFRATLAPTVVTAANRPFFVFPSPAPGRSSFSSPWHLGRASADLPLRFGEASFTTIDPGASSISIESRHVTAGASTEPEWWGPGIRNALVLSTNAAGIPRIFVRTAHPIDTRLGAVDAELITGTLTESRFFDANSSNDYRSVSGLRLSLRVPFDTGLTLGVSRVVYGPESGAGGFAGRALDALTWWKPLARLSDSLPDGSSPQERDQITALSARWVLPQAGAELYAEWARMELPRSIREAIESPQHTQGFTLGAQWAHRVEARRGTMRTQAEFTELSQSQVYADRPPPDFYTGRATAQGWTQRGQPLGAAIGPGGQSQWLAADWLADAWQGGVYAGRIRWENDALYRQVNPRMTRHDVSLLLGTRGAVRRSWSDIGASLTLQRRLNYLFQNEAFNAGETNGNPVDITNVSLTLSFTPR